MSKIIVKLIAVLLITILTAAIPVKAEKKTAPSNAGTDKIASINLTSNNCNIDIYTSETDTFKYEYDSAKFQVTRKRDKDVMEITAKVKKGAKPSRFDRITIYIPSQNYNSITVNATSSGISLPELNTNLYLTNDHGAMSITLPADFTKEIHYNTIKGVGSIVLNEKMSDYEVDITTDKLSFIDLANGVPLSGDKTSYERKYGEGTAKIIAVVKGSIFSIEKK